MAWFALVPLLWRIRTVPLRQAFRAGFTAGAVFWLMSLFWLTHVTAPGWFFLALYCALYTAFFAVTSALLSRWFRPFHLVGHFLWMLGSAIVWGGWEYIRYVLFTGFSWNALGVSQVHNLPVLQLVSWGGVYIVSSVIIFFSCAVVCTLERYRVNGKSLRRFWHPELMVALLVWAVSHAYGVRSMLQAEPPEQTVRVGVVQPNIPQVLKWTAEHVTGIYNTLESLTKQVLASGEMDFIVWPETALPDDVRFSPASYDLVNRMASNNVPLLIGSMDTVWVDGEPEYYNSSFLFDTNGALAQAYDKQHLVMFGEYVPLGEYLPFLNAMTPIGESMSAGDEAGIFHIAGLPPFATLICFEDSVPKLAREAVLKGARMLINQTNDAWFDVSSGSRQHMVQCICRCVENRVPAVRVANTGVSCVIDSYGRVLDVLADEAGVVRVADSRIMSVPVPSRGELTVYTRFGDRYAQAAAGLIGLLAVVQFVLYAKHRLAGFARNE